jgi:hypothetical protein
MAGLGSADMEIVGWRHNHDMLGGHPQILEHATAGIPNSATLSTGH